MARRLTSKFWAMAVLSLVGAAQSASAQTTYTWSGSGAGGSSTAWLTTTNWGASSTKYPGLPTTTSASSGSATDIAVFNLTSSPSATGINMNTAGGRLTLAAISSTGTGFAPTIGNSSTTFSTNYILALNNSGSTQIAGFENVILNNSSSTAATMTFQSFQSTTTPRTDLLLNSTTNVINITAAASAIVINNDIYETNAGTGFTLQGAGALTLAGTGNRFTGNITAAGNGRFIVNNSNSFGSGTVTFNNSDDKSAGNFNITFNMTGTATRTMANNFVLSPTGSSGFAAATSNGQSITLSGLISGGGSALNVAFTNTSATAVNNFFILTNAANSFSGTVIVGASGLAVTSDGALGNVANALTLNANDTARGGFRFDANNITLSSSRAVSVTNSTIVDTNGFNATIAGTISNTTARQLIKAGTGTLNFTGNTNTIDAVTVRNGTLNLDFSAQNNNKLASNAALTLAGGTLQMTAHADGSSQTILTTTLNPGGSSGIAAISNGGTGAVLNIGTITRNAGATVNFTLPTTGQIQLQNTNGAANMLLDGAATVNKTDWASSTSNTVSAFNSYLVNNDASTFANGDHITNNAAYSGTVNSNVAIGSLRFNNAAAGSISINPSATLTINSGSAGAILVTPSVTGNQQIVNGTLTAASNELIIQHYGLGSLTISSVINGAVGVTKSGGGTLVLSGSNTYAGKTIVNEGVLSVSTVTTGGNLGNDPGTAGENVVLGNGTLRYTAAAGQTLAANRSVTLAGANGTAGATIDVSDAAGSLTIAGIISGPEVSSLTKAGPGILTLSGTNTYNGDTIVSNGTVQAAVAAGFGNQTNLTGRVILGDANTGSNNVAALVSASTAATFANGFLVSPSGTGTATIGAAAGVTVSHLFTGEVVLGRSVTLQAGTGRVTFNNRITGTGDVTILSLNSAGVVGFERGQGATPSNDWTGNLILAANSTLMLGSAAGSNSVDKSIPDTANVIFNTGSKFQLSPAATLGYESVNALISQTAGDGAVTQTTGTATFRLTVGAGNGSGSFSGVISNTAGTLAIIKSGAGTQTFSGANTYTGGTTINGGTLAADTSSPNSSTGTAGVIVNSGGRLRGIGNVAGAITLNTGGTLAPGNSSNLGTLSTAAAPVFNGGTFSVNMSDAANYGRLSVTAGNIALGSGVVTLSAVGYTGSTDAPFTIIQGAGAATVTGRFANFAEGAVVFSNSTTLTDYVIYYGTYSGLTNSVVIAPVPEPAAVLSVCAAGAGAFGWLRSRRRK